MGYHKFINAILGNRSTDIQNLLQEKEIIKTLSEGDNMLEALRLTIKKGFLEVLQALLGCPIAQQVLNQNGFELLKQAVGYNQRVMVEYLLKFERLQALVVNENNVILLKAASAGYLNMVELLLKNERVKTAFKKDADDFQNHTVLNEAILKRRQDVIYKLAITYLALGIALPDVVIELSNTETIGLSAYVALYKARLDALRLAELKAYHEGTQEFIIQGPRDIGASYMAPPEYLPYVISNVPRI